MKSKLHSPFVNGAFLAAQVVALGFATFPVIEARATDPSLPVPKTTEAPATAQNSASSGPGEEARLQALRDAVAQRWKAIIARDWDTAHALYTRASQVTFPKDRLRMHWEQLAPSAYEISETDCEAEACRVMVMVTMRVRVPRVGFLQRPVPMVERWLLTAEGPRLLHEN